MKLDWATVHWATVFVSVGGVLCLVLLQRVWLLISYVRWKKLYERQHSTLLQHITNRKGLTLRHLGGNARLTPFEIAEIARLRAKLEDERDRNKDVLQTHPVYTYTGDGTDGTDGKVGGTSGFTPGGISWIPPKQK